MEDDDFPLSNAAKKTLGSSHSTASSQWKKDVIFTIDDELAREV